MTQPAKVQEPSMEEILASIRRIIADDEAKPAAAEKTASPAAAKPAVMRDIPPSAIAPVPKPAPAPKPVPPPPAPEPVASNNQDDIDAMLASLDAATPEADIRPAPQPEPEPDVFELTDEMALPEPTPAPAAATFSKVEPQDDIEFTEARASRRQPAYEPPFESAPARPILSHSTVSAVESAFNSLANTVLSNNARTLEDLVKEMLRPMLKSWLDDNLPGLVERIVKAEIERVSRGR
ncbi:MULTISPECIES: PopZ family protein [unclassified Bradyrhizobium]|uniref:PopZ family protein n=1 Tax=unclassified Bradyrhizobium TaxID=2631580 RepID=UPI002FEF0771